MPGTMIRVVGQKLAGTVFILALLGLSACRTTPSGQSPAVTGDNLPTSIQQALGQFNHGAALLEQYRYSEAAKAFQQVLAVAPDWSAARFNLGLAYLNMQEEAGAKENLERAKQAFETVLSRDPNNLHARFSLGLYYQHTGDNPKAAECFAAVHKADPSDPYVAYKYAEVLITLDDKERATELLEGVLQRDPGFVSAVYRLATLYQRSGQREKAASLFARFRELKDAELTGGSFTVLNAYGTVGKYYMALGPDSLPIQPPARPVQRILFSPELKRLPTQTSAWGAAGVKVNVPGVAAGDVDGDGDIDLCLTGLDGEGTTSLWLNDGSGKFTKGQVLTTHGVCPALGDVDNDGDLDLWLGRVGGDTYFANDGKGNFQPVSLRGVPQDENATQNARLLDIDSDGDLDLIAFRLKEGAIPADGPPQLTTNYNNNRDDDVDLIARHLKEGPLPAEDQFITVYNNNRDGSFVDVAEKLGVAPALTPIAACVCDDFDNDRDLDLILFFPWGGPVGWVNDRVWKSHLWSSTQMELPSLMGVLGATTGDVDNDGARDLLVFTTGPAYLFLNQGDWRFNADEAFTRVCGRLGASGGQFVDIDNDGDLDIVVADASRPDNTRGPALLINEWPKPGFTRADQIDPGNLLASLSFNAYASCVAADFTGDGRVDLLLAPAGAEPFLVENVTKGGHWIEINLQGIQGQDGKSRSNNSAIGARVEVKAGMVSQQYVVGVPSGPVASPPLRIHAGLGANTTVDWLRITWPDAVLQAELELPADQVTTIAEVQRKVSSCPHLFAWDGSHYEFICDFGGMGGLAYLVGADTYSPPDATEYVPIPNLKPRDGAYVVQIVEPLEEVVYLDQAELIAVDHPEGTAVYPNEMMAVNAPPPAFELFCVKERIEPVSAIDHRGADVTQELRQADRRYAGPTELDNRFVGYAKDHFVELDFGDRLQSVPAGARLVLFLTGWVEYAYSSTNFAAGQAGLCLKAPSVCVERDGRWVELFHEVGYPAGIRHTMTLDVTGKLRPTDRRIRISDNMELYWDQIFLAPVLPAALLHTQSLAVDDADLHFLGYPREYSPDGRLPTLYDYSQVDRAIPWKTMRGAYTRYGPVTELVRRSDDCYVIMGPGEEVTLRFPADGLGPVPDGCVRSFILMADSYCKDMDLYTGYPETVEPLPFHRMNGYPYGPDQKYPDDAQHREYRTKFNTRSIR
jgi:tetratricopeptide (TPR) repeat protein